MTLRIERIGLSRDLRTNRWSIICQCGKRNEPSTTMRATQRFQCEKCQAEIYADYNANPPTAKIIEAQA
jgi:predicted SprT family Zn-dependent metalloprotease